MCMTLWLGGESPKSWNQESHLSKHETEFMLRFSNMKHNLGLIFLLVQWIFVRGWRRSQFWNLWDVSLQQKVLFVCLHDVGWTGDSVLCVYIVCGIYWPALLICCSYFLILAFCWLKIVSMSCKLYSEVFVDTTHFCPWN